VAASANPDHVIMWCSSNTFWGGTASSTAFKNEFREMVNGRSVTMGAEAAAEALKALETRRAAIITPYPKDLEPHIEQFFGESGIDVVKIRSLERASADEIVNVPKSQLIEELRALSELDADVILQLGAAMSMLRLAAEAEDGSTSPWFRSALPSCGARYVLTASTIGSMDSVGSYRIINVGEASPWDDRRRR
jgi:maleate isomerase